LTKQKQSDVYQLKVTLEDIKPPIWRRILVTGNTTLSKLHRILQVVMGWDDYHLHQFIINDIYYGTPDPDFGFEVKNEKNAKLEKLFSLDNEKSTFFYEYDFGDSWYHSILIEKIMPFEPGKHYPVCIKGKRACPPEDCGGVGGYYHFLEAIQDPEHPDHDDMMEWREDFDPEAFDIDAINLWLKSVK
jgi:hypothetical protein